MTAVDAGLENLQRQHPEWRPWLTIVAVILDELANPRWAEAVPAWPDHRATLAPLLTGAKINPPVSLLRSLLSRLIQAASVCGSEALATLSVLASKEVDVCALFRSALIHDNDALKKIAESFYVDSGAFESVAALVPMPLLQTCNRVWGESATFAWIESYCPICGSWPAFAEIRGIERNRYLRCGRCGSGWKAHGLICPYCGLNDHKELESLVPENHSSNSVIDACKRCLGYVKSFTKLQGAKPADVLIDDLASVELDIAAAAQGYKRPQGAGYSLDIRVAIVS